MTKKDFELIANALRVAKQDCVSDASLAGWAHTVAVITTTLATTNPRFDRARFLLAAGVTP